MAAFLKLWAATHWWVPRQFSVGREKFSQPYGVRWEIDVFETFSKLL